MGYEIIVREYDDDGKMLEERKVNRDDKLFDGCFVVGDNGSGCTTEIEHMSLRDIAYCIASNETLLCGAIIAEAIEGGMKLVEKRKEEREIKKQLRGILGDR